MGVAVTVRGMAVLRDWVGTERLLECQLMCFLWSGSYRVLVFEFFGIGVLNPWL